MYINGEPVIDLTVCRIAKYNNRIGLYNEIKKIIFINLL